MQLWRTLLQQFAREPRACRNGVSLSFASPCDRNTKGPLNFFFVALESRKDSVSYGRVLETKVNARFIE
jgi:hypothetical protein